VVDPAAAVYTLILAVLLTCPSVMVLVEEVGKVQTVSGDDSGHVVFVAGEDEVVSAVIAQSVLLVGLVTPLPSFVRSMSSYMLWH
jgi:hypothetical protein